VVVWSGANDQVAVEFTDGGVEVVPLVDGADGFLNELDDLLDQFASAQLDRLVVVVVVAVAEDAVSVAAAAAAATTTATAAGVGQGRGKVKLGGVGEVGYLHQQVADVEHPQVFGAEQVVLGRDGDDPVDDGVVDDVQVAGSGGDLLEDQLQGFLGRDVAEFEADGDVTLDAGGFEGRPVDEDVGFGGLPQVVQHRFEAVGIEVDGHGFAKPVGRASRWGR